MVSSRTIELLETRSTFHVVAFLARADVGCDVDTSGLKANVWCNALGSNPPQLGAIAAACHSGILYGTRLVGFMPVQCSIENAAGLC